MLISLTKSFYHDARELRCPVPAPSFRFSVGGWMTIVRHLGKGHDRPGSAAESEEDIARFARLASGRILTSLAPVIPEAPVCA